VITIYACAHSGVKALAAARGAGLRLPAAGCRVIEAPCLGSVKKRDILAALTPRGDRVLLIGCHPDNCNFVYGNKRCGRRVAALQADMQALAIGPERVRLAHAAAVEGARCAALVEDFIKDGTA
jgi:F420-non-reducing hydrogenase iron-sulfur subunit